MAEEIITITIDEDGTISEADLLKQCQQFMNILNIKSDDLIEVSYSDLLLKMKN